MSIFEKIRFEWVGRLSRVVFIVAAILSIFISYSLASDAAWYSDNKVSVTLLYLAFYLFVSFVFLIVVTKTLIYITKGENFLKAGFSKKNYLILAGPILISLLVSGMYGFIVEPIQENNKKNEEQRVYTEALSKVDNLRQEIKICLAPILDQKYSEKLRSCTLYRNKVKHDYDFCVSLESINSPASCLYDNDYQSIDCSETTIKANTFNNISASDLSDECQKTWFELKKVTDVIEKHSKQ
jgi:hypothetical protein